MYYQHEVPSVQLHTHPLRAVDVTPAVATSSVRVRGRGATGAASVSMGLVDAVPDKLKNVFASKPKPKSRRFVVVASLCLVSIDATAVIQHSGRAL